MSEVSREALLGAAFIKLADTLIDQYDVVDLLHTLVEESTGIFHMQAGGLLLVNAQEELELVASTNENPELVGLLQLSASAGPSAESFTTGKPVAVEDIAAQAERWPAFRAEALALGLNSLYCAPMRLRGRIIGALSLFGTKVDSLSMRDAQAVQALADAATIGILQERLVRETAVVTEQLNRALTSRIFIEQAKGVLAESHRISMDEAFTLLRQYSRNNGEQLQAVAKAVASRSLRL